MMSKCETTLAQFLSTCTYIWNFNFKFLSAPVSVVAHEIRSWLPNCLFKCTCTGFEHSTRSICISKLYPLCLKALKMVLYGQPSAASIEIQFECNAELPIASESVMLNLEHFA